VVFLYIRLARKAASTGHNCYHSGDHEAKAAREDEPLVSGRKRRKKCDDSQASDRRLNWIVFDPSANSLDQLRPGDLHLCTG
jgi:hypothetical protein